MCSYDVNVADYVMTLGKIITNDANTSCWTNTDLSENILI